MQTSVDEETAIHTATQAPAAAAWPPDLPQPTPLTRELVGESSACCLVDAVVPGEPLVVCFGLAPGGEPPRFDFFGRTKKLEQLSGQRLNRVLLRDPHDAFWQRGVPGLGTSVDEVAAALRRLVDAIAPSRVVMLGQSTGAYGALLFGALITADRVVAFGPPSSLDPEATRAVGHSRWLPRMEALQAQPAPGARLDLRAVWLDTPHPPELRIHYGLADDPALPGERNADVFHALRIASLRRCRARAHANAPHEVLRFLREQKQIDALLLQDVLNIAPAVAAPREVIPPAPKPRVESAVAALTPDWSLWVAENRLRGCTPESMVQTMTGAGLDRALSERAVAEINTNPCYRAAERFAQHNRKLHSVIGNLQKLWEQAPQYGQVEKRAEVSKDEFVERYCIGNRPLVLTGMTRDWPALERWSPQYLKQRFGQEPVEIQFNRDSDADYERNKLRLRTTVAMSELVDKVLAVGPEGCNDFYLTANNEALRRPGMAPLLADIGSLPEFMDRSQLAGASSLWFGPAGTVTPLHHDTLMLLHTQIVGRKRWRFISPLETPKLYNHSGVFSPIDLDRVDTARFPEFAGVKVLEVVVEPGETVFLPLGWWHQVTSLDACLSVSFTNLTVPNHFTYVNPDIRD